MRERAGSYNEKIKQEDLGPRGVPDDDRDVVALRASLSS